jgi:hypothetical protein
MKLDPVSDGEEVFSTAKDGKFLIEKGNAKGEVRRLTK